MKKEEIDYNKLNKEKAKELQDDLLSLIYDEGYYINENNISDFRYYVIYLYKIELIIYFYYFINANKRI